MEMLQSNQDLNMKDYEGVPVLHRAIENENLEIVNFLLFPPGNIN
jgi:ankyrin repeat protein